MTSPERLFDLLFVRTFLGLVVGQTACYVMFAWVFRKHGEAELQGRRPAVIIYGGAVLCAVTAVYVIAGPWLGWPPY